MISKRFADVAAYCISDMQKQLDAGLGKKSYRDYIIVLNRYLIPYFGDKLVTFINYEELQRFAKWRADKMGREDKSLCMTFSTLIPNSDAVQAYNFLIDFRALAWVLWL